MAKPQQLGDLDRYTAEPSGDLYPIFIPLATYRALSDVAAERGLTFNQLLCAAIESVLTKPSLVKTDKQM